MIQDVVRLNFFSQPDGPVMGNGSYKSSVLVPGYAFEQSIHTFKLYTNCVSY